MAPVSAAVLGRTEVLATRDDFTLDIRVVESLTPVPGLAQNTDDGCGSSCAGPCVSFVDDPYEPAV